MNPPLSLFDNNVYVGLPEGLYSQPSSVEYSMLNKVGGSSPLVSPQSAAQPPVYMQTNHHPYMHADSLQ